MLLSDAALTTSLFHARIASSLTTICSIRPCLPAAASYCPLIAADICGGGICPAAADLCLSACGLLLIPMIGLMRSVFGPKVFCRASIGLRFSCFWTVAVTAGGDAIVGSGGASDETVGAVAIAAFSARDGASLSMLVSSEIKSVSVAFTSPLESSVTAASLPSGEFSSRSDFVALLVSASTSASISFSLDSIQGFSIDAE